MCRGGWIAATVFALVACAFAGCQNDSVAPSDSTSVRVSNLALVPNSNNALSATVTFDANGADSARVVYTTAGGASGATPFTTTVAPGSVLVLGLRPATSYDMLLEVADADTIITTDSLAFTTDTLPSFLQSTTFDSDVPSSGGYILTAVGDSIVAYVVAFDSTGAIRWYRAFEEGVPAGEIKQQANGDITVFLGATHGGEPVPGRYVELSPDGNIVRTFAADASAFTDNHELWLLFRDGTYNGAVYLTYTQRHVDLSAEGGPTDTLMSGHQLVRVSADGSQHTLFDAWDHFALANTVEPIAGEADFDHPNSIDIAPDGNYVVSWRNFDAITKIDAASGAIVWTLAAPWSTVRSDFTIEGDPLGGFSAQHSVRVIGPDDLLVFDNGTQHTPSMSRGVEYRLDEAAKTATMSWEYRHEPPFYTQFTGSVQRLENGNTLIGWTWPTNPLTATEVTPDGNVAWEGALHTPSGTSPYRFTKIASLYRYERP